MGLIRGAFDAAGNISIIGKLKQWAWEKAEPKVADFIRGVDYSTFIEGSKEAQEYDTKCTEEEKAEYVEKGSDIVKAFENLGKCDTGERNIDAAMYDIFKDVADKYKDDPGKVGYCIFAGNPEYAEELQNVAVVFNDKFAGLEASGAELNYETIGKLKDNDEEFKAALDKLETIIDEIKDKKKTDKNISAESSAEKTDEEEYHNDLFKDSVRSSFVETAKTIPVIGNIIANKQENIEAAFDKAVDKFRDGGVRNALGSKDPGVKSYNSIEEAMAAHAAEFEGLPKLSKIYSNPVTSIHEDASLGDKTETSNTDKVALLQQNGIYMPDGGEQTGTSNAETSAENDDI